MENETFATELLHELKASSRRWFICFIVMVILEVLTIIGFLWYNSLPISEDSIQYEQNSDNLSKDMIIGGDYEDGE